MVLEMIDSSDVMGRKPYNVSSKVKIARIKQKKKNEMKRLSNAKKIVPLNGLTIYVDE